MKLNEFIKKLESIKKELSEKEVVIVAENGLEDEPQIRFDLINKYDSLDISKDNVKKIVITY